VSPPVRATTAPASTTDPLERPLRRLVPLTLSVLLVSCGTGGWGRRPAAPAGLARLDRQDPALSGDGRLLATIVPRAGQPAVMLQELSSGRLLPLRHLRGDPPHRSPSLSWTGRYVAVLAGQGPRRLALIEDRASGRLHRLPLPPDLEPERLSLAPDGRRLAIEALQGGRARIRLFALSALLEPDLPAGQPVRDASPGPGR
jgi:hypothetical protein